MAGKPRRRKRRASTAPSFSAHLDALLTGSGGIDGIVIVRNDQLVAEAYFNGYARETQHDMRSVTKSFTASVAGIAIEQRRHHARRHAGAAHRPVRRTFDNMDARKRSISVANVLNMQTGLDCDDGRESSPGNEWHMYQRDDWIKYMLGVPMQADPGTFTSYCSGGVTVLGSIIAARIGPAARRLRARRNLLAPLQHESGALAAFAARRHQCEQRDSAAAARCRQVRHPVPEWRAMERRAGGAAGVGRAFGAERSRRMRGEGYGWLWWKSYYYVRGVVQPGMYASGNGGNYIFVLPSERLVVVITASNYNRNGPSQGFFRDSILPTIQ